MGDVHVGPTVRSFKIQLRWHRGRSFAVFIIHSNPKDPSPSLWPGGVDPFPWAFVLDGYNEFRHNGIGKKEIKRKRYLD